MIVKIDSAQITRMKAAIEGTARKLRTELAIAVNQTAAKGKRIIAKEIGNELATAQKNIAKEISTGRKANAVDITSTVEVKKTSRIPLREFGARQTKKGVSFRVSKSKGRKTVAGAFQVPRPGLMNAKWRGRVFKRLGKSRLPITQLMGPSAWGVFVVGKKIGPSSEQVEAELKKNIDRRIKFIMFEFSQSQRPKANYTGIGNY
jgi:hypothetical protein